MLFCSVSPAVIVVDVLIVVVVVEVVVVIVLIVVVCVLLAVQHLSLHLGLCNVQLLP